MSDMEWSARAVEPGIVKISRHEEVTEHPLNPITVTVVETRSGVRRGTVRNSSTTPSSSTVTPPQTTTPVTNLFSDPLLHGHTSLDGSDPLSQFARQELDPLSKMAADEWDYSSNTASVGKKSKDISEELVEPWSARRATILAKYTTSEKLSIVTSFLMGGEKVVVKVQPSGTMVDKVRTRLEQLDDFEEGSVRQMLDLSQQEYTIRIEQLNHELVQAWHSDQRVKALKIAIQCAKLLGDTSVISFYPSKFVLITDILDIFGKLVYDRLKLKAEYCKPGSNVVTTLPNNFTPEMVKENAKETCRNWFYKIASIRELVPRLYLEMAIIKSYGFLTTSEFSSALLRITRMIRGIGNPLIAVYARCYLCRVGLALNQTDTNFVQENFYDFLTTYDQLFSHTVRANLIAQNITMPSYMSLYMPALDWILQVMVVTAPKSLLTEIVSRCKRQSNSGLLLNTILAAFKPAYVAARAMEFIDMIATCDEEGFPQHLLYRRLGQCLGQESFGRDDSRRILNAVWQYITNLKDPVKFMLCAEVWIHFTILQFSSTEVNLFLGETIAHLTPDRAFENHYSQMQTIVEKIVANTSDFESLLTMDNFLPLIDLFHKESIKVEVCKTVMEGLGSQSGSITDPIIINALMYIARIMHDSVSALTVDDEKRQIGHLICGLVQRIDYGRDFEKQLSFYAEARAAFPNLDAVHIQLVQCVNRLAIETRKIVRGHHTRRTSAFVRACAAFCFITIPSLTLVYTRLQLYLLSGQVALLNQCLGQADACFKAALSLVPEMPKTFDIDGRQKSSEPYLLSYLSNFLSTLLVVPDSPEHGVLYLMRGLLNAVQRCFEANSTSKSHIYLQVLDLLSTVTQESYPYHVDKIDSNDTLYGCDKKFVNEVNKICSRVLEEILTHLKYLDSIDQPGKQSVLALALFTRIVIRADLRQPALAKLAYNLWKLSQKHGSADPKLTARTIAYMKRSQSAEFAHFSTIVDSISNT